MAPEDANTAVCVLPGTELAFAAPVRHNQRGPFAWKANVVAHTTAIFRQINKDKPHTHHDALEFPDGQIVLLTDLFKGQQATVLQLPAQPKPQPTQRRSSGSRMSADGANNVAVRDCASGLFAK